MSTANTRDVVAAVTPDEIAEAGLVPPAVTDNPDESGIGPHQGRATKATKNSGHAKPQSRPAGHQAAQRYIALAGGRFRGGAVTKSQCELAVEEPAFDATDGPRYFDKNQHNVLVVLGNDSGNLTDIDLDWPEAASAADIIFKDLPSFGRSGKPRSHRLGRCADIKSKKYQLPQSLANHSMGR